MQHRNGVFKNWTLLDTCMLSLITLIIFSVQVWLIKPPAHSDQLSYFISGSLYPNVEPGLGQNRLGMVFPIAFFTQLFGYSEAAYYALPFISLIFLSVAVYLLAWLYFGTGIAFVSTWLVFGNSLVLEESSYLLPDIPSAVLFTIAIFLIAVVTKNEAKFSPNLTALLCFFGGLFLGFTYLVRENALLMFIFILPFLEFNKTFFKKVLYISAGSLVVLFFETWWFFHLFDDPLSRYNFVFSGKVGKPLSEVISFLEIDYSNIIFQVPRFFLSEKFGFFYLLLFVVFILITPIFIHRNRSKGILPFFLWGFGFWVIYTIIALSPVIFDAVFIRLHKFRYWFPLMIPLAIVGSVVSIEIINKLLIYIKFRNSRVIAVFLFSAVVFVFSYFNLTAISCEKRFSINGANKYSEFRDYLIRDGQRQSVIWIDRMVQKGTTYAGILPMYTRSFWGNQIWNGNIKSYISPEERRFFKPEELTSGLIIYDNFLMLTRTRLKSRSVSRNVYPDYTIRPQQNWSCVFSSSNKDLMAYDLAQKHEAFVKKFSASFFKVATKDSLLFDRIVHDSINDAIRVTLVDNSKIALGSKVIRLAIKDSSSVQPPLMHSVIWISLKVCATPKEFVEKIRLIVTFISPNNDKVYQEAKQSGLADSEGYLNFYCHPPITDIDRVQFQIKMEGPSLYSFDHMLIAF